MLPLGAIRSPQSIGEAVRNISAIVPSLHPKCSCAGQRMDFLFTDRMPNAIALELQADGLLILHTDGRKLCCHLQDAAVEGILIEEERTKRAILLCLDLRPCNTPVGKPPFTHASCYWPILGSVPPASTTLL